MGGSSQLRSPGCWLSPPALAPRGPLCVCIPGPDGERAPTRSPRPRQQLLPLRRAAAGAAAGAAVPAAGRGVAAPRACGAATWAGRAREPQGRRGAGRGRDGLQTPSPGGAARSRVHTRPGRPAGALLPGRGAPGRGSRRALGSAIASERPLPADLSNLSGFGARGSGRQGFRPGTLGKLPALPRPSAQPIRSAPASQGPSANSQLLPRSACQPSDSATQKKTPRSRTV